MSLIKIVDRVAVRVTATESGDWQVVDVPPGFVGITAASFADNDFIEGHISHEDGAQFEVYSTDDGSTDNLLQVLNVTGTVVLRRPTAPYRSSASNNGRMTAGTGIHTLEVGPTAGVAQLLFNANNPVWRLLPSGDSTPDVTGFRNFITAGGTTITRFDGMAPGQRFTLRRGTSDIAVENNAAIVLAGGGNITLTTSNPIAEFVEQDGVAYQTNAGGRTTVEINELARDAVAAAIVVDGGLTKAVNDGADTITLGVDAVGLRAELGLGTAALLDTGTDATDVPTVAQADARYTSAASGAAISALLAARTSSEVDVTEYGAKCDARTVFDAAVTNGSATVTSATAAFSAGDVGKVIIVQRGRPNGPDGSTWRPHVSTIASVQSATSATMAAAATNTVSGVECIIGTDDTAAFQTALNDVGARTQNGLSAVTYSGHAIITQTLRPIYDYVRLVGRPCRLSAAGYRDDLLPYLAGVPSRIIWGGADGARMIEVDIIQSGGVWRKLHGISIEYGCLDGAGRAGDIVETYSAPAFNMIDTLVSRNGTGSDAISLGVTSSSAIVLAGQDVAARDHGLKGVHVINRGTNIFGSNTLRIWGDKGGEVWGNLNYGIIDDSLFLVENDGSREHIHFEQIDTTDVNGSNWNGRLVLHAADSGTKSRFNGVRPNVELFDGTAPSTRTVTLRTNRYRLTVVGSGSVTVTSGTTLFKKDEVTALSSGGGNVATSAAALDFMVAGSDWQGGSVTFTVSGSVTSWSLVARPFASQSRTVTFNAGCSGLIVARAATGRNGGAEGQDSHAVNHLYEGYDVENINVLPIIEQYTAANGVTSEADLAFSTNGLAPQARGSFRTGYIRSGAIYTLAADLPIASGAWMVVTWPAPVSQSQAYWDVAHPTRITPPAGVKEIEIAVTASFNPNATGYRLIRISRNGIPIATGTSFVATGGGNLSVCQANLGLRHTPRDFYEIEVFQNTGDNLNLVGGQYFTTARITTW